MTIFRKRSLGHFISLLLVIVMLASVCSVSAFAAGDTATASIPIEKRITGDTPSSAATFTFVLEGKTAETPMPANTTNGCSITTINGAGTANFGAITYTVPNDYYYTVYEKAQNLTGYTIDETKYSVLVQVTTDDNGKLTANIFVYKSDTVAKQNSIVFTNQYKKATTPTPPKPPQTGDNSNLLLWICLATMSAAILLFLVAKKKHDGKNHPQD